MVTIIEALYKTCKSLLTTSAKCVSAKSNYLNALFAGTLPDRSTMIGHRGRSRSLGKPP